MMMSKSTVKVKYSYQDKGVDYEIRMDVNLDRFHRQIEKAQYLLDSAVMDSMVPYMPKQTGTFVNATRAMSASLAGSGVVVAAAPPMGRYLYEGKVMVDAATGKGPMLIEESPGRFVPRFRKGARLKATDRPLNYSKKAHPKVEDHWFEKAKDVHGKQWIKLAKKEGGGG